MRGVITAYRATASRTRASDGRAYTLVDDRDLCVSARATTSRSPVWSYRLVVEVTSRQSEGVLRVRFDRVLAFRVMDEAYLLEFWEAGLHDGPVFEITAGGWKDHESARGGAVLLKVHYPDAREYLALGGNDC